MISFPIQHLLDEESSYEYLCQLLHPDGLKCPNGHTLPKGQKPHERKRAPVVNYRCQECGKVYNAFTGTLLSGTHYDCNTIILLLRGVAQGKSSRLLADELELDYSTVLKWRHRFQEQAIVPTQEEIMPDEAVEGDELFQNAGEKGDEHNDPDDPPRQRSNPKRGRGTAAGDRPVVVGVVGRESGRLQLTLAPDTTNQTLVPLYVDQLDEETTLFSDEAHHFDPVAKTVDRHHTTKHGQDEYAKDPDGDGFHEVHSNTIEGIWVGLRNFIRPFRGVHKRYLRGYLAIFEWAFNIKHVTDDFLRSLLIPNFSPLPT